MDKIRKYREYECSEAFDPQNMQNVKDKTGNVYESLVIVANRSKQISIELKEELHGKLEEFASTSDTLEEVLENREQIEISKYYEKLAHPTILARDEFLNDKIHYRHKNAEAEDKETESE